MDDGAAGEVDRGSEDTADRAVGRQDPVTPDHEGQRAVDEGDPGGGEDQPRGELRTVGHGPGDEAIAIIANVDP